MEDPLRICLVPRSLVMTTQNCFYCQSAESTESELIDYNYGIHCCKAHRPMAVRDCHAYLHQIKYVKMSDATKHPLIGPFIYTLQEFGTFRVKRTNGEIEEGWVLRKYPDHRFEFIIIVDDIVLLPVVFNNQICRRVKLLDFLDETIMGFPMTEKYTTIVKNCNKAILDGIYLQEYEEHEKASESNVSKRVDDEPCIEQGVCNGQVVRVCLPPS